MREGKWYLRGILSAAAQKHSEEKVLFRLKLFAKSDIPRTAAQIKDFMVSYK